MAKYGEGGKRWIVEERPDGANVHNWHWAETDCLPWSKTFFTKSLSDLTILDCQGILSIKTKKVEKVDGEAYVNVRKGKIIPGYEISLSLSWEGEAKDGEGKTLLKAEGNLEIPYISDENAGEDPEVKVTTKDEGPIGKALKEAMLANGKPLVLEKVSDFVKAMAKGGPVKDELEAKKSAPKNTTTTTSNSNSAAMSKEKVGVEKEAKKEVKKEGKKGFKTITMSEKFNCRAKDMYEILMDENRWKGFSQSNARISKEVGGQFSIFDGSVTGINLELEEGKLIAQRWRFGSWSDGIDSTVRLVFNEPEPGVTVINLTHSDVPEEDRYGNATVVENTERGWRDLIFKKVQLISLWFRSFTRSLMASCIAPVSISGGSHLQASEICFAKSSTFGKTPSLAVQRKPMASNHRFSVCAEYRDGTKGGGNDFAAGFLLGGALFGTLGYIFAPQIRRSLLNEDEYGFRKAKRPIYYDGGLEKTRQTLNAKIRQLNSAIDNVSSRLRGGNNSPSVPVETDPEVEATM